MVSSKQVYFLLAKQCKKEMGLHEVTPRNIKEWLLSKDVDIHVEWLYTIRRGVFKNVSPETAAWVSRVCGVSEEELCKLYCANFITLKLK